MHLDDWLVVTSEQAGKPEKARFVADPQKSVWEPVVWHRFIVDVALRQIEVPM